ncbi:neuropeptides capa receptor-like [Cydia fagiglandana]|uniref:neuropeptides capa receptor-like n=1 Tax=Cydia fagiglandana TaxID=1458189 RepID=UPI002FEDF797
MIPGLAPELWYYWQMYPYIFGEVTCRLTNFLRATGTWASSLTVVAFSIERYAAICHHSPSRSRDRRQVAMAILAIWSVSVATALPAMHVHHVVKNPVVVYPGTGKVPSLTQLCRVPEDRQYKYYNHLYATTCALFFFIPMAVLVLVYIKIAVFIRSHRQQARNNGIRSNCSEDNKIFKVLVAVVLAFFMCGAPYHYQRLTTIYSEPDEYPEYHRKVFVLTALFYYVSATVNPILYNAMSKRYRKAFKEVITRTRRQQNVPMTSVAKETSKKYNTTIADSYTAVAT